MNKMFLAGIADYFTYDNKKRSSKSSKKKNHTNDVKGRSKRGKRRRSSLHQKSGHKVAKAKEVVQESSVNDQDGNAMSNKHVLKSNLSGCSQREVAINPNALPVISIG